MEAALVSGFLKAILPSLLKLIGEKYKLQSGLEDDIESMKSELLMIAGAIEDQHSQVEDNRAVLKEWIALVRDLAYQIEDCIDRFMHRVICEPEAAFFRRNAHRLKTMKARYQFAAKIKKLKKKSKEIYELRERYLLNGQSPGAGASTSAADPHVPETELVGIEEPRSELMELLMEVEDQPKQLKVISIAGFGGLGKTVLAGQVYESVVDKQFDKKAWVCAAGRNEREILRQILRELGWAVDDTSNVAELSRDLRSHLATLKYFIVIDDMRTDQWNTIKYAFPENNGKNSRIIVTTTIRSVANASSSAEGFVYNMRTLDDNNSKELFLKASSLNNTLCPEILELILKKCDGLPLALVSIAQFLTKNADASSCEDACRKLGGHLEEDVTLARMQRVLVHNYTSLAGPALKASLLYFGMFPSGRPIRRGCLIRRWLAEGLVETESRQTPMDVADKYLKTLIDRNVIYPIDVSNDATVKTCQTPGIVLEFILQKSVSENFITLPCNQKVQPRHIRRLSLHQSSSRNAKSLPNDLSLVRSLTIFGKASKAILDFQKYKLLRVLDIENCDDLEDRHLEEICKLLQLKYLSLKGTISKLPKKISNLQFLETLDLRSTNINTLPTEVIELPCLVHLIGKFKLHDSAQRINELQKFLSDKSNLETVAGIVIDGPQGFPQLMGHMNKLRKVKIWLESSAEDSNMADLSTAIEKFIEDVDANRDRSLSLDFEKCSQEFLHSLKDRCCLSSLKLHGMLRELPRFVTSLYGLKELCLSSTKLSGDLLAVLGNLRSLLYLKLIEDYLGNFVIKPEQFPILQRLCLVTKDPALLNIEEGALPCLASLQLFCKYLKGVPGVNIKCLKSLVQIALDSGVSPETKKLWEEAAKEHRKRPKVVLINWDDPSNDKHTESSVAPEQSTQESETQGNHSSDGSTYSSEQDKRQNCNVHSTKISLSKSNLNGRLNFTSWKKKIPKISPKFTRRVQNIKLILSSENTDPRGSISVKRMMRPCIRGMGR